MKRLSLILAVLLSALIVGASIAQTEVRDNASRSPERHVAIDQAEESERYTVRASLEWTEAAVAIEQLVAPRETKAQAMALSSSNTFLYAACVKNYTRGWRTCWRNLQNCSGIFCVAKFDRCTDEIHHALERCLDAIE